MSVYSQVTQNPQGFYDAFGRQRVSNPTAMFDSQMQYDKQPFLWVEKTAGTATVTHRANESAVDLTLGTASGDRIVRQTREYIRYQPGKSQLVLMTTVLGAAQDGTEKLVGYGDDENGIFVGQDGGGMFVLLRSKTSGAVDDSRKVYQADWSLDKLDGSSPYKIDIDQTAAQIVVIDLEWLGVGRVRVGFNINGTTYLVHEFLNANNATTTYMTTANLPCRYEIKNTATVASAPTLKQICSSVLSEGGADDLLAYPFSAVLTGVSMGTGVANAKVVFATRHSLTFKGIENRVKFAPKAYEVLPVGGTVITKVLYNPTLTGGTWAAVNAECAMEGASDVTAFSGGVFTGIDVVAGGSSKGSVPVFGKTVTSRLPFGLDVDGANPVPLAMVAYALENNVTASFSFQWEELR